MTNSRSPDNFTTTDPPLLKMQVKGFSFSFLNTHYTRPLPCSKCETEGHLSFFLHLIQHQTPPSLEMQDGEVFFFFPTPIPPLTLPCSKHELEGFFSFLFSTLTTPDSSLAQNTTCFFFFFLQFLTQYTTTSLTQNARWRDFFHYTRLLPCLKHDRFSSLFLHFLTYYTTTSLAQKRKTERFFF